MLLRSHYTKFLIFLSVYVGINLLIIRIKSSYISGSVSSALKTYASNFSKEALDINIFNEEQDSINALPLKRVDQNLSIFLKVN